MRINTNNIRIVFVLLIAALCSTVLVSCSSNGTEKIPGENESDWEISNLVKVSKSELTEMIEEKQEFYVYFGRPSCPDCTEFYPKFKSILEKSKITVYYFSTEAKASKKAEMRDFIKPLKIKEVPAILHIKDKTVVKIYDGQKEEDLNEFNKLVIS